MALSGAASRRPLLLLLLLLLLLSSLSGLQVGPRPSHLSHTCPGGWRTMAKRTAKMAADGGGRTDGGQDRGGRGVRDGDPTPSPPRRYTESGISMPLQGSVVAERGR